MLAPGEKRKKDWNKFLIFMKANPETMLNLVPSPHHHPDTIEYPSAKLISSSNINKHQQQQRPNSSYNQIQKVWTKSRLVSTG